MIVLGIETTCDETAAALVERWPRRQQHHPVNVVYSQDYRACAVWRRGRRLRRAPAADRLDNIIMKALSDANIAMTEINAPPLRWIGLIGGVIVGLDYRQGDRPGARELL